MIAPHIRIATAATLAAVALVAAPVAGRAADLGPGPSVIYAEPPVAAPTPFYVVNQGPVHSGPAIFITATAECDTDLKRVYPYIRAAGYSGFRPVRYRPILRRLGGRKVLRVRAQAMSQHVAAADSVGNARAEVTGSVGRSPLGPRLFHAKAEVRLIGRNRIDIKLYRNAHDLELPAPVVRKHKKPRHRRAAVSTRSRPAYVEPAGRYIEREGGRIGDIETLDLSR